MMISPRGYLSSHYEDSFEDLIKERNELITKIARLEEIIFDKDKRDPAWQSNPGPDVKYQMNLEYLSILCRFIHLKYNKEIVWDGELDKESIELDLGDL